MAGSQVNTDSQEAKPAMEAFGEGIDRCIELLPNRLTHEQASRFAFGFALFMVNEIAPRVKS